MSDPSVPPISRAQSTSASLLKRTAALAEVVLAFVIVHVCYRSFKRFTDLGHLEASAGLNFSTGGTMILFTVAVLLVCRRSFADYGLTTKGWRYSLNLGLFWGVLIIAASAAIIRFTPLRFDPITPPDMTRGIAASVLELAATLLLLWFLRRERTLLRWIPVAISIVVLICLLSLPPALAWHARRPVGVVLLTVLWVFVCAGFGEEIFFRGYIQSRLNQAFGRPFRFMGVNFGIGLFVSALLFGFIHALNTVDYFAGRWDFAWWWLLFNFVAGLFFGCLREKTGSMITGGVQHGLFDVLARLPG